MASLCKLDRPCRSCSDRKRLESQLEVIIMARNSTAEDAVVVVVVVVVRFYTALLSALEQIHCALVVCD